MEFPKAMLLTVYLKYYSSLWSISNIITWYTLVLAVVSRPLYIDDDVLIVITVFDESGIIQIEPVP